jgi:hypothetical protein
MDAERPAGMFAAQPSFFGQTDRNCDQMPDPGAMNTDSDRGILWPAG